MGFSWDRGQPEIGVRWQRLPPRTPPSAPDEGGDEQQQREKGELIGQEGGALSHAGEVNTMGLEGGGKFGVGDGRRDLARVVVASFENAGDGSSGVPPTPCARCRRSPPRRSLSS